MASIADALSTLRSIATAGSNREIAELQLSLSMAQVEAESTLGIKKLGLELRSMERLEEREDFAAYMTTMEQQVDKTIDVSSGMIFSGILNAVGKKTITGKVRAVAYDPENPKKFHEAIRETYGDIEGSRLFGITRMYYQEGGKPIANQMLVDWSRRMSEQYDAGMEQSRLQLEGKGIEGSESEIYRNAITSGTFPLAVSKAINVGVLGGEDAAVRTLSRTALESLLTNAANKEKLLKQKEEAGQGDYDIPQELLDTVSMTGQLYPVGAAPREFDFNDTDLEGTETENPFLNDVSQAAGSDVKTTGGLVAQLTYELNQVDEQIADYKRLESSGLNYNIDIEAALSEAVWRRIQLQDAISVARGKYSTARSRRDALELLKEEKMLEEMTEIIRKSRKVQPVSYYGGQEGTEGLIEPGDDTGLGSWVKKQQQRVIDYNEDVYKKNSTFYKDYKSMMKSLFPE
jgi:hypothetical protein